jgi:hypothetical protein
VGLTMKNSGRWRFGAGTGAAAIRGFDRVRLQRLKVRLFFRLRLEMGSFGNFVAQRLERFP